MQLLYWAKMLTDDTNQSNTEHTHHLHANLFLKVCHVALALGVIDALSLNEVMQTSQMVCLEEQMRQNFLNQGTLSVILLKRGCHFLGVISFSKLCSNYYVIFFSIMFYQFVFIYFVHNLKDSTCNMFKG